MAGKWQDPLFNNVGIGFFYDSIELNSDGTKARIKGGRIRIRRNVNISDSTNKLEWSGGAINDGSKSNINVSGKGDATIQTVTGSWVTLSTTKAVTSTAKIVFTGINYAVKTLEVTVKVTYPIGGDGGSPSNPNVGGGAYPNLWEDENAPDFATESFVKPIYAVRLTTPLVPAAKRVVPAWDIEVNFNGGNSPYGAARFKMPLSYLNGSSSAYRWTDPFRRLLGLASVQIDAGWEYSGITNIHTLFSGYIVERNLRIADGEAYVEVVAESYETLLDFPSPVAASVGNTNTRIKQFYDSLSLYDRNPEWNEPSTNLPADTAQLTEYRAAAIEKDDTVSDWFRQAASTVSQWMRGGNTAYPSIECLTDPYPYQRLVEININAFSELTRSESLDDWGNILRLSTTWTINSDGDTKDARRTFVDPKIALDSRVIRAQDVSLNVKPPSGKIPANWSTGKRWLRRINEAKRGEWSGTCRALWWLQPRLDGIVLTENPLEDNAGQISSITFLVDQGLMNVTWNVVRT